MIIKKTDETEFYHRHLDDVAKIKEVINHNGYHCTLKDAANIWQDYSDLMAAGWMGLPERAKDIWLTIQARVEQATIEDLFDELRKRIH